MGTENCQQYECSAVILTFIFNYCPFDSTTFLSQALEAPKEPRRPKTHWDHVLEEMVWLSKVTDQSLKDFTFYDVETF